MKRTPQQVGPYTVHVRTLLSDASRPTILLVHGLGVSGDYFIPYARALADSFTVYIVDLPGYGKTPKPKQPLSITALANIVIEFTKLNGIEGATVMGQSMGCQIVTQALAITPRLFSKVILVGPTSNKNERTLALHGWRLTQDTFREPLKANVIVFTNYVRMGIRRYLKTAQFMLRHRIEDDLPGISVPILFVRGVHDPIAPSDWLSYLQSITPNASMVEIANAAHLAQYKKAAVLAAMTKEFIET